MWDNGLERINKPPSTVHQEIYQIWVDLLSSHRMTSPSVTLLGGSDETPVVMEPQRDPNVRASSTTMIIAGQHAGEKASGVETIPGLDLTILQVTVEPGKIWEHNTHHQNLIIYVRKGTVWIGKRKVSAHCTAFLSQTGKEVFLQTGGRGADFLFLSGNPLEQTLEARGSMVGENENELHEAFADYELNRMGLPWKENLTDKQWKEHVNQHPCDYKFNYYDGC
mmetsp:Transcript_4834/g.7469  ORF Transcript_4834/g.7469 Transcript_4834/m.7469 type:complete len:223 (+) Transcript_4834:256-924(+)|eukprot:CAMPEP_0178902342 /NCGR_PEP_ID=MMETSP0786-20121207/4548_1 /TAXON_ID=186022 /ORGANISM="Thalassionema frauenfeldii, Strain CCMP 1798" /LENGTH=222 /DNA_ID=CAMNT_0020573591 /DNA_START=351 /DNA_END=1019 /DNA_ORIENTATION=+